MDIIAYYQEKWDDWWWKCAIKFIENNPWFVEYYIPLHKFWVNPNLTMKMVEMLMETNHKIFIDYHFLSSNPNLTIQFVNAHPNEKWNWRRISRNYGIAFSDILQCPQKQWDELSENPNVTIETIKNNLDLPWNLNGLCNNPNITIEIVTLLPKMINKTGCMNWKNFVDTRESIKTIKTLFPDLPIISTQCIKYQPAYECLRGDTKEDYNVKIKKLDATKLNRFHIYGMVEQARFIEFNPCFTYDMTKPQYLHNNTMWVFLATILDFYETPTNFTHGYGNFTNADYVFSNSYIITIIAKN